jgi:hypothetical protein
VIEWGAFAIVAGVSIGAAVGLVALFSLGLRLLAVETHGAGVRVAAYACFVVAAAGALYGIYLLIPAIDFR